MDRAPAADANFVELRQTSTSLNSGWAIDRHGRETMAQSNVSCRKLANGSLERGGSVEAASHSMEHRAPEAPDEKACGGAAPPNPARNAIDIASENLDQ